MRKSLIPVVVALAAVAPGLTNAAAAAADTGG